jgi:glycosyltransferase involved in cell wall biosynthesis
MSRAQASATSPKVLFVSGLERPDDASRIYRCDHQVKQLRQAGAIAEALYFEDVAAKTVASFDVIVFARCNWHTIVRDAIASARHAGKLVLGEIDDKVIEPWEVEDTGFMRSRVSRQKADTRRGLTASHLKKLRVLPLLHSVLVSTPGLKDNLEALGMLAHVSRNAVDTDVATPIEREHPKLERLLVMTGTRTHDADLRTIAYPLGRFLHENPDISCTFLGPFELPAAFQGLRNVVARGRLPMAELYPFVAEHDLCLVPLEDTEFNDSKSALKLLECGIVSVPVLASQRRDYRDLIRDNQNGFLANDDPEAWFARLCELRDRPELLSAVSREAFRFVSAEHTVISRGTLLLDLVSRLGQAHAAKET